MSFSSQRWLSHRLSEGRGGEFRSNFFIVCGCKQINRNFFFSACRIGEKKNCSSLIWVWPAFDSIVFCLFQAPLLKKKNWVKLTIPCCFIYVCVVQNFTTLFFPGSGNKWFFSKKCTHLFHFFGGSHRNFAITLHCLLCCSVQFCAKFAEIKLSAYAEKSQHQASPTRTQGRQGVKGWTVLSPWVREKKWCWSQKGEKNKDGIGVAQNLKKKSNKVQNNTLRIIFFCTKLCPTQMWINRPAAIVCFEKTSKIFHWISNIFFLKQKNFSQTIWFHTLSSSAGTAMIFGHYKKFKL